MQVCAYRGAHRSPIGRSLPDKLLDAVTREMWEEPSGSDEVNTRVDMSPYGQLAGGAVRVALRAQGRADPSRARNGAEAGGLRMTLGGQRVVAGCGTRDRR